MNERPIASIRIGNRHRKDMGDIAGLAANIAAVGLIHPVVITPDNRLIAGERRLRAAQLLGWTTIPVTIVSLDDIVRGEFAENTQRKDFTWTEAVAIGREVKLLEKAAAKQRQRAGGRAGGQASGKLPQASKGSTGDKVAKAVGKKRRTLEKAEAIVAAAETNPQRYTDLVERLEEDGARVDIIHRELRQREARTDYEARKEQGCTIDDLKELARKRPHEFRVIYIDWPSAFKSYSSKGKQRSPERHYDTMPVADLKALKPTIQALMAKDCAVLSWTSGPHNKNAIEILEAWGLTYSTWAFAWVKTNPSSSELTLETLAPEDLHRGTGYTTAANVEIVLLATHGSPMRLANDVDQGVIAPQGKHSEKPEEVRRRIERLYAGPYLELFGRKRAEGWTVFGNEIDRGQMASGVEVKRPPVAEPATACPQESVA